MGDVELLARTPSQRALRDRLIEAGRPMASDVVADLGSGTGLLALALAPRVAQIWAIDRSQGMCEYLATKALSADIPNLRVVAATISSIPLVDASVDLVVSSYCFHELPNSDKSRALAEAFRILVPGGRLVIADMMFSLGVGTARDRRVLAEKVSAMLCLGRPGIVRLACSAARIASGRWEAPAPLAWWQDALARVGFQNIEVTLLEHEAGIALGRRPHHVRLAEGVSLLRP